MPEDTKTELPRRPLSELRNLMAKSREGIVPEVDVRPFEQYVLLEFYADTKENAEGGHLSLEAAANLEFLMNAFGGIGAEIYSKDPLALLAAMQALKTRITGGAA